MSNITTLGIDLAKSIFQLCGLNQGQKVIFSKQVKRARLLDEVRKYPNAVIAMEACGSRIALGHKCYGKPKNS